MKRTGFSIPDYDAATITFADEPFGTDASGSPSETVNHAHLERVRIARDEHEARELRARA